MIGSRHFGENKYSMAIPGEILKGQTKLQFLKNAVKH